MTCCNYDCEQGRDCPARVAKVGQRIPAATPLLPSRWNTTLRRPAACWLVAIWLSLCAAAFIAGLLS